jgi:hypothetical protein
MIHGRIFLWQHMVPSAKFSFGSNEWSMTEFFISIYGTIKILLEQTQHLNLLPKLFTGREGN